MENEVAGMTELLNKLDPDVTFRPDDGAFRSKMAETVIADGGAEFAELFSERSCDILVSISGQSVEEGIIRILVSSDRGENSLECPLAALNKEEISDFSRQLSRQVAEQLPAASQASRKVVVRKKVVSGMLNISQAAQGLGCSEGFLKSRIPCSDYSYDEVDGKTEIREYFWSQQLVDRLCHVKSSGAKAEDVEYVAGECCHGDIKWAEEILGALAPAKPKSRADGPLPGSAAQLPAKAVSKVHTQHRRPRRKKP